MLGLTPGPNDKVSAVELVERTSLDQLEETVKALKKHRPVSEVRTAMLARIAHAPIADFEALKNIYLKHCGQAAK
jgi:hypothetical protein